MIEFLNPLIFILFFTGSLSILFKRKFSEVLPLSLIISVLILYICAIFGYLTAGSIFLIIPAGIFPILFFICFKKGMKPENLIFTDGFYSFLIIYSIIFVINFNRGFWFWDEISHWGPMVKESFRLGTLYSEPSSYLAVHKDYPPSFSLLEYLWCFLCGKYKEAFLYRALQTFCLSLMIPFAFRCEEKHSKSFILLFSVAAVISSGAIFSIEFDFFRMAYIDAPISFLFAFLVSSMFFDRKISLFNIAKYSFGLSFLLISKQITLMFWGFFIIYSIIAFILRIKSNRYEFFSSENENSSPYIKGWKLLLLIVSISIVPFVFYMSWGNYVKSSGLKRQFDGGKIGISSFIEIAKDEYKDSFRHKTLVNYLNASVSRPLFVFKKGLSECIIPSVILCILLYLNCGLFKEKKNAVFWNILILFVISFGISFICGFLTFSFVNVCIILIVLFFFFSFRDKNKENRGELLSISSAFTIFSILYFIAMMMSYVFCFEEIEGPRLASFERYMTSWPAAMFYIFSMIFIGFASSSKNYKKLLFSLIILSIFSIASFGTLSIKLPISYSSITDVYKKDAENIINGTPEKSSVFFVAQDGGFSLFSISYLTSPRRFNFDIFDLACDDPNLSGFNSNMSPEDFLKKLKSEKYEFVYIRKFLPSFSEKYSVLFEEPPLEGRLYMVSESSNVLLLKKD